MRDRYKFFLTVHLCLFLTLVDHFLRFLSLSPLYIKRKILLTIYCSLITIDEVAVTGGERGGALQHRGGGQRGDDGAE